MPQLQEMLSAHPRPHDTQALSQLLGMLATCALTCASCADACLAEEHVDALRRCIRVDLDCADLCATLGSILVRQTALEVAELRPVVLACAELCDRCAQECQKHAGMHAHCGYCAEVCRLCAQACRQFVGL